MKSFLIFQVVLVLMLSFAGCENRKKDTIYDDGNTGNSGDSGDSGDSGNTGLPDSNPSEDNDIVKSDDDMISEDADLLNDDNESDEEPVDADNNDDISIPDEDVEKNDDGERVMTAVILLPTYSSIHEGGKPFQIKGEVSDTKYPASQLNVKWEMKKYSGTWTTLVEDKPDSSGITEFQHTISENDAAYFSLRLTAIAPDNTEFMSQEKIFGICTYPFGKIQDFNDPVLGDGWVISGDAYLNSDGSNGWLELTGDAYNKRGVIYNNVLKVYPGDITIKLDIRTGQPSVPGDSGADGFAMTVFDSDNAVPLADYVAAVKTGGCLGYGVAG
ncbi:MAG TPA: hypothetical protein VLJ60_05755, partial [bacterium]|nr:hypothetical protein [bacterium]